VCVCGWPGTLIAAAHRSQADALEIEAGASAGPPTNTTGHKSGVKFVQRISPASSPEAVSVAEIGLTHKRITKRGPFATRK